ncbi:alpha/beta superfamily hydrolase [Geomicrobium sp. JCM 19038]|nr:alpha/beta superfamily hydrolase [Geomicrobium sp. JCM 19038]
MDDAILAGFSMGGAIAIRYMARHEGKGIRKLALLGAAAPVFTERDDFQFGIPKDNVNGLIEGAYEDRARCLKTSESCSLVTNRVKLTIVGSIA